MSLEERIRAQKKKPKTKATRLKLERVLDLLDEFLDADNVDDLIDDREKARIHNGRSEIAEVESRLFADHDSVLKR